ncbi:MAG: hypothetical protein IJC39_00130, partial [Firmicutes bacterium]|nr:hypothetical protein [Bacillota bacterium]
MTKRKNGIWQKTIRLKDKHGKPVGKPKYFYGRTEEEILQKISEYEKEQLGVMLFRDAAEEWKLRHWQRIEPSTAKGYNPSLKRAAQKWGDMPIKHISPMDIDSLLQELAQKNFSKKVVLTQLTVINMIFKHALLMGYCDKNPCTSIRIPGGLPAERREPPSQ